MLHEPKEDCFAYRHPYMDGCDALNQLYCKYGNGRPCPFYKSVEEANNKYKWRVRQK